jgi:hypothetical protein
MFVTKGIANLILKLKKEAKEEGFELKWVDIKTDNVVILANENKQKACFISKGIKRGEVIAYKINVQKFLWAEEEGFTIEEMVEDMAEEVFQNIQLDKIVNHLK